MRPQRAESDKVVTNGEFVVKKSLTAYSVVTPYQGRALVHRSNEDTTEVSFLCARQVPSRPHSAPRPSSCHFLQYLYFFLLFSGGK